MELVSLQGSGFMAARDTSGNRGALVDVGDASVVQVSANEQTSEYREHKTGNRNLADVLSKSTDMEVKVTLGEWLPENLVTAFRGTNPTVTGSTVAAETLPSNLALGDYVALDNFGISGLTIQDSAGTPATLVEGTDYQIVDAKFGRIKFIGDLSTYTQPFTAGYTFLDFNPIVMLGQQAIVNWFRFEGISTAVATEGQKYALDLYKVRWAPLSSPLDMVNEDYGNIELTGMVLYDDTKLADANLGQFGRLTPLG